MKQAHIAEVAHFGHWCTQLNFNYIQPKSTGFVRERTQVGPRRASQNFPLSPVDRVITRHARPTGPGLYLHEDQHFLILGDQINFFPTVLRVAPVPRYDDKAFLAREILGC